MSVEAGQRPTCLCSSLGGILESGRKEGTRRCEKGWKTIFEANGLKKQTGVAILISNKIYFQPKVIKKEKERHFILIKGKIFQNELSILNMLQMQGQPHSLKKLIQTLGRQRQVYFWVWDQPGIQSELQDSQDYTEKPCLEKQNRGWWGGSVVKSTDCSSRGPEFKSQQPHGGSQPSTMGSDALF